MSEWLISADSVGVDVPVRDWAQVEMVVRQASGPSPHVALKEDLGLIMLARGVDGRMFLEVTPANPSLPQVVLVQAERKHATTPLTILVDGQPVQHPGHWGVELEYGLTVLRAIFETRHLPEAEWETD